MKKLVIIAALLLGACKTVPDPEPRIEVVEVKVAVPVPCKALEQLGPEPEYPDSDAAIQATDDVGELAKLYVAGRLLRIQRLAEYTAAKSACIF